MAIKKKNALFLFKMNRKKNVTAAILGTKLWQTTVVVKIDFKNNSQGVKRKNTQ